MHCIGFRLKVDICMLKTIRHIYIIFVFFFHSTTGILTDCSNIEVSHVYINERTKNEAKPYLVIYMLWYIGCSLTFPFDSLFPFKFIQICHSTAPNNTQKKLIFIIMRSQVRMNKVKNDNENEMSGENVNHTFSMSIFNY